MTTVDTTGKLYYAPDMAGDPLKVEKGWSHFNAAGQKDFLSRMTGYETTDDTLRVTAATFRGSSAEVRLQFVSGTAIRFRMIPDASLTDGTAPDTAENAQDAGSEDRPAGAPGFDQTQTRIPGSNPVFDFPPCPFTVREEEDFFVAQTPRLQVRLRKCPWEMTVLLDGEEIVREQIKDHNVDQKYKAVPVGFTRDADGRVTDVFETLYMHADEDYYGFGEKFTDLNKRGQKVTVWQRDAQSTNSDVSYKGMPYYMSSYGYALLVNTYTRTHFNMGASSAVSAVAEAEDPVLDYYLFCNRSYKGLLTDYTALSGRSAMIPKWAFGFWMSRMSYRTRAEVEEIVTQMADFGMSVDVIHIDGWMNHRELEETEETEGGTGAAEEAPAAGAGAAEPIPAADGCAPAQNNAVNPAELRGDALAAWAETYGNDPRELLSFDEERFPDPEGMIRWLREREIHLSLWMFPYVTATPAGGGKAGQYGAQFIRMRDRGFLVKNRDGEPYVFSPGEGDAGSFRVAALDFTNPEMVAYLKARVRRLMRMGVGVIKTDFSEEIPEDAVFWDGSSGLTGHNKYTLLYAKTIYEASAEAKLAMGERALLWGRSGYAGSQNYPANWAGDSSAALNNLPAILNGGLSIGLSGVSFWGFDIGGFYNCDYAGNRVVPDDLSYIRSVQMGLMSPLSRSHGQSTPREPWVFSADVQQAFLAINKFRYRLLPYLYSTAWETVREGLPMMRAMLLEFPEDRNCRGLSGQYMLGSALLAAPVFDEREKWVYLPAGSWIDLTSGERIEGPVWTKAAGNDPSGGNARRAKCGDADDVAANVSVLPPCAGQAISPVPLYLRENAVLPVLKEAPMHVPEGRFGPLTLVCNIGSLIAGTDRARLFVQPYYDDGLETEICASSEGGMLSLSAKKAVIEEVHLYSRTPVSLALVNKSVYHGVTTAQGALVMR